jgi:hypothetical protein
MSETTIEVENKINFRNIFIIAILSIIAVVNSLRDFGIYQLPIGKLIFPDPVVYTKVVTLNQSMMSSGVVLNNAGTVFNFSALAIFVLVAVILIGSVAGMMGMRGGMGD